jgi:lambda family phage portal protein
MFTGLRRKLQNFLVRSYDGAGGGRRWRDAGEMARQLAAINAARGPIAKRARYLDGNNALAAAGTSAWVSAAVGSGIKPQSSHPDPAVRKYLNLGFERLTDSIDPDGLTDFYGQQALVMRRTVIDGDCFGVMTLADRGALRVRVLDADQVDPTLHREIVGGARIMAGVEFDAAGRRVAFHTLKDRPGLSVGVSLDMVRLPAEDVCHVFHPITPGQVRGLSWFAPVLLRLHDLDGAHDAQLMRQKVAALFAGFIFDGANGEVAQSFPGTAKGDGILDGGLEPGTLKVVPPGKDIKFSDPADIGAEAIDFLKVTAHDIAAGLGVPYEQLTGDLSGTNYSSIRAGLVEFRRRVEAIQHSMLVFQFCRPVWNRYVTTEILSGRMSAPGFAQNPEQYLAAKWITPRMDWVDPKKDAEAEIAAIGAGLLSRRQAVASRGLDIEALDEEIAADNERAKRLGLTFTQPPAPAITVEAVQ